MLFRFSKGLAVSSILVLATIKIFSGELPEDIFKDEATFLKHAGPEWSQIAEGVYERQTLNGKAQRIGFGLPSFEYYLEVALSEQAALVQRVNAGEKSEGLTKELEGNAAFINHLKAGLEEGYANRGESGSGCAGNFNLNPTRGATMVSAWAQSTASWSEFGPYAPYVKHFYVSARATNLSNNTTDFRFNYGSTSYSCCYSIDSGRAWAYQTWSYIVESRAVLYINNGCSLYRVVENPQGGC